ncbi:DUF2750 domain-containing protein [Hydrocarboniclastica marina]|uniref:DUF2750 domain-containing protein n=1 Tax=Hydrocarboniclastica marina TaxID=2259620 RepID=A0A4P7XD47_9ALTE|nr:DUF2750 domain-containing protein [Hydrocarboniclastica marina]MAL97787.1 hypothetical protein [Alteromonadaceae bacterium]QCF24761.1 DUF2750 domain-containing protein [Hydrocarboniclastica marina]|tara:strand:- start:4913 stop:5302 length:390 start_codon:yes stop_codon:yes gene_type:complete
MSNSLSPKEINDVLALDADDRYDYLVAQVVQQKKIWSLHSERGWVMVSTDQEECLPIWPDEAFATPWITEDWSDCKPVAIKLEDWIKRWLPGMQGDGIAIAVFPGNGEDGMVVDPEELRASLVEAMTAG